MTMPDQAPRTGFPSPEELSQHIVAAVAVHALASRLVAGRPFVPQDGTPSVREGAFETTNGPLKVQVMRPGSEPIPLEAIDGGIGEYRGELNVPGDAPGERKTYGLFRAWDHPDTLDDMGSPVVLEGYAPLWQYGRLLTPEEVSAVGARLGAAVLAPAAGQ